jgi:hypothetical protein
MDRQKEKLILSFLSSLSGVFLALIINQLYLSREEKVYNACSAKNLDCYQSMLLVRKMDCRLENVVIPVNDHKQICDFQYFSETYELINVDQLLLPTKGGCILSFIALNNQLSVFFGDTLYCLLLGPIDNFTLDVDISGCLGENYPIRCLIKIPDWLIGCLITLLIVSSSYRLLINLIKLWTDHNRLFQPEYHRMN